jgi:N-acyl-D-aspartate/D-glutamate deacylase
MDFLIYIVVAVVACWIGWHARGILFLVNISENPDRVIKMLEQIKRINEEEGVEMPNSVIEVLPEFVGAVCYAYAKEDGQFLGQGTTLDEALQMASARFPNKKFWCKVSEQSSQTA